MEAGKEKFEEVVTKLRAERDELRVKAHLASMDVKEEWEELEKKWHRFESRVGQAKDDMSETSKDVGERVDVVAEELKSAYERIRERLGTD